MNGLEFLMMQVLWFLYHIRYYTITFSTKHNSFLHAVTGSSSGLLLLNIVSLWFEAVEVTEAEVVAAAAAAGASGCGCWPELLVKLAAVCCKSKENTPISNTTTVHIRFIDWKVHNYWIGHCRVAFREESLIWNTITLSIMEVMPHPTILYYYWDLFKLRWSV